MKTIALVNSDNLVVNVVLFDDDATEELMQEIANANNAVTFYDLEIYGKTGIGGDFYDGKLWLPKPHASWVRGDTNWEAPVLYPQDGQVYVWSEETLNWKLYE
jgi:hypothetical protein